MTKVSLYWSWVESEAALIDSDGCTKVTGFRSACCWEHDLAFYYAKNPRSAYRLYIGGTPDYWQQADPITFDQANGDFRTCHAQRSTLGAWWWLNPLNVIRWRGVVRLSRGAWERHREREAKEQT